MRFIITLKGFHHDDATTTVVAAADCCLFCKKILVIVILLLLRSTTTDAFGGLHHNHYFGQQQSITTGSTGTFINNNNKKLSTTTTLYGMFGAGASYLDSLSSKTGPKSNDDNDINKQQQESEQLPVVEETYSTNNYYFANVGETWFNKNANKKSAYESIDGSSSNNNNNNNVATQQESTYYSYTNNNNGAAQDSSYSSSKDRNGYSSPSSTTTTTTTTTTSSTTSSSSYSSYKSTGKDYTTSKYLDELSKSPHGSWQAPSYSSYSYPTSTSSPAPSSSQPVIDATIVAEEHDNNNNNSEKKKEESSDNNDEQRNFYDTFRNAMFGGKQARVQDKVQEEKKVDTGSTSSTTTSSSNKQESSSPQILDAVLLDENGEPKAPPTKKGTSKNRKVDIDRDSNDNTTVYPDVFEDIIDPTMTAMSSWWKQEIEPYVAKSTRNSTTIDGKPYRGVHEQNDWVARRTEPPSPAPAYQYRQVKAPNDWVAKGSWETKEQAKNYYRDYSTVNKKKVEQPRKAVQEPSRNTVQEPIPRRDISNNYYQTIPQVDTVEISSTRRDFYNQKDQEPIPRRNMHSMARRTRPSSPPQQQQQQQQQPLYSQRQQQQQQQQNHYEQPPLRQEQQPQQQQQSIAVEEKSSSLEINTDAELTLALDEAYMLMAIAAAMSEERETPNNPSTVGAVLVAADGTILGEARSDQHTNTAIRSAIEQTGVSAYPTNEWVLSFPQSSQLRTQLATATLYLTSEPSDSQEPKISELIARAGIRRVVIGSPNRNLERAEKCAEALREKGIEVSIGTILPDMCSELLAPAGTEHGHTLKTKHETAGASTFSSEYSSYFSTSGHVEPDRPSGIKVEDQHMIGTVGANSFASGTTSSPSFSSTGHVEPDRPSGIKVEDQHTVGTVGTGSHVYGTSPSFSTTGHVKPDSPPGIKVPEDQHTVITEIKVPNANSQLPTDILSNEKVDEITLALDEAYMLLAVAAAMSDDGERAASAANSDPTVGAVLVAADGSILGEACSTHRTNAIWQAIEQAGLHVLPTTIEWIVAWPEYKDIQELIATSTLYVTLEPPAGNLPDGPPIADLLREVGIPRVVIGSPDPSPTKRKKGAEALVASGIDVSLGTVLPEMCDSLIILGKTRPPKIAFSA